ncbi:N-terminal phage integrase SAM-like domain-containing protein [Micromonospora craterilacus]|uniref:N-terminal phage integrase SAM-like domain-containing protein n=1 Tax=Micromonospora craterilacus TaxID=1655439 RepID=UPI001F435716|nr:N-terminal phage integrase SAM-like domain-containing protein [Micromonospora craterilacus]
MTRARSPEGALTKRCTCTDPDTGKRLGGRCPKLRRPGGGSWHPTHGVWGYQLELPIRPTQPRRQLRRSGFDDRDAATAELRHARALLDLAAGDPHLAIEVGDLLHACRPGTPLPDRDAIAARIRAGVPASVPTTTGEYLTTWLEGRRGLAEKTLRGYSDHIRQYLIPHLGKIPIQNLRTSHIEAMFTAIGRQQDTIRAARASTDPEIRAKVKGVRPMEAASIQRLYATLRKALNDAVIRAKLIPTNPALGIELPTARRPKARVWTAKAVEHWQATGKRPSTAAAVWDHGWSSRLRRRV